ncbi:MAG TPA: carboxypeptidase-like regulatory domain-containing protein [Chloroflexota bacterium]|jgi:cell division septation protein DedD
MIFSTRYRLGWMLAALSLGLASVGSAQAQQGQSSGAGLILGEVDKCVNGNETPAPGVTVGIQGGNAQLTRTDATGEFAMSLAPGQYTVQATADDGTMANRPYVPVEADSTLDIGVLDLAGGCSGGDVSAPPAPAPGAPQATAQPTAEATATPVPPSPTPAPTQPPATATPAPDATDQSSPDQSTPDQSPDTSPDTSSDGG